MGGTTRGTRKSSTNPGQGPGWGGEAKGAATDRADKAPSFVAGNTMGTLPPSERRRARIERSWALLDDLAEHADWRARAHSASEILDRLEGKPVQRNLNINADGEAVTRIEYTWAQPSGADDNQEGGAAVHPAPLANPADGGHE